MSQDHKSELLEQLRIDRSARPAQASERPRPRAGRGWWIGALVIALVAGGWLLARFAFGTHGASARTSVARSTDAGGADGSGSGDGSGAGAGTGAAGGSAAHSPGALLDASGYVVALREATVSGKGIYKVNEVLVEEGQRVRRGQIIARLDDSNVRAALDQARAQVLQMQAAQAAAQAAAADTHPTFLRDRQELAEGLISQDAFDASKASDDAARLSVDVARQNLAFARATVEVNQRLEDDTVIRAPFDGVVTSKSAQPGEIVSPQFQGGGGLAQIVDMDSLEVDVDVNENYINRVHAGQPATIQLDAYQDWTIPAHVIAIIPTADRSKGTIKVRVGFDQRDARIVPEMGAHVQFLADVAARGH